MGIFVGKDSRVVVQGITGKQATFHTNIMKEYGTNVVAGVTPDLVNTVKAGEMLGRVAAQVGGKGGGKPDFAMAGGNDVAALEGVLGMTHERLVQQLANRK